MSSLFIDFSFHLNLVAMAWELIEVAGNLTPLPHSTVDVVAAKIESKLANTVIRQ